MALTGRGREVKHVEGGNVCGVVIQPAEREQAYHPAPRRRREDAHKHLSPPSAPLQLRTNSTSPPAPKQNSVMRTCATQFLCLLLAGAWLGAGSCSAGTPR